MLEKFKQYFSILEELDTETDLNVSWLHVNILNRFEDKFTIINNDEERLVIIYDEHGDSDEHPFVDYETRGEVIIVNLDNNVILVFNKSNQVTDLNVENTPYMFNIHTSLELPPELISVKDSIIKELQDKFKREVSSVVNTYKKYLTQDQEILNCKHDWVTSYERTSAYDSEYVTQCKKCKCGKDMYLEICKKYEITL